MLQISNLDDGKSEWNINETHIIIPMIDGDIVGNKESDKSNRNCGITLNSLNVDQSGLPNGLEQSFVIGLDRNLFETHNNNNNTSNNSKSDLLVIQNSDLKLLSCNSESRNPIAYTLSYVDQDRNEILWETSLSKEVKDVLSYDDSVQESSKNWSDDLEKNEQINLVDELSSHITKIDCGLLIPIDDTIQECRKSEDIIGNSHFVVNYFPLMQSSDSLSLMSNRRVIKQQENVTGANSVNKQMNLIQNELLVGKVIEEPLPNNLKSEVNLKGFREIKEISNNQENATNVVKEQMEIHDDDKWRECIHQEADRKRDFANISCGRAVRKGFADKVESLSLEKSLPLKKKAKMKRTMVPVRFDNFLTNHDPADPKEDYNKEKGEKMGKFFSEKVSIKNYSSESDSDEPLINKLIKGKKIKKLNNSQQESSSDNLVNESNRINQFNTEADDESNNLGKSNSENEQRMKSTRKALINFEQKNFGNIFDLLDDLKKCRLITASVWQTLRSGLNEMDVDILKEMKTKRNESTVVSYSTQLKAFALVLYFKQPAAFNHLAEVYRNGWPSLNAIKEWKRKVNNTHQRANISRLEGHHSKS